MPEKPPFPEEVMLSTFAESVGQPAMVQAEVADDDPLYVDVSLFPEISSVGLIVIANKVIKDGRELPPEELNGTLNGNIERISFVKGPFDEMQVIVTMRTDVSLQTFEVVSTRHYGPTQ